MPVQRTHKQSDLEKRLRILESQLYGKSSEQLRTTQTVGTEQKISTSEIQIHRSSDIQSHSESFRNDITYLRHDLTKIAMLSTLAITIQLVLYFSHALERVKFF